jgi:hypothetical protein
MVRFSSVGSLGATESKMEKRSRGGESACIRTVRLEVDSVLQFGDCVAILRGHVSDLVTIEEYVAAKTYFQTLHKIYNKKF